MRPCHLFRPLLIALGYLVAFAVCGQANGIKFLVDYYHPTVDQDGYHGEVMAFGLGYDHDFASRIGCGLDVRFGAGSSQEGTTFEILYNTKYFVADNSVTAFYLGSFIGYQRISGSISTFVPSGPSSSYGTTEYTDYSRTQIPLGLRLGLRGGLPGFFGEIFGHVGYSLNNGEVAKGVETKPLFLSVGVAFGGGWD